MAAIAAAAGDDRRDELRSDLDRLHVERNLRRKRVGLFVRIETVELHVDHVVFDTLEDRVRFVPSAEAEYSRTDDADDATGSEKSRSILTGELRDLLLYICEHLLSCAFLELGSTKNIRELRT
jgi:hypothetical protein